MPHNQLKLQGGAIVNETPVVNQAGIATCNRIRYMPDLQGLTLPQKLGGWAKFYATQITVGIVRALWGWQDTSNAQWLAWGADVASPGSSGPVLAAVQCTVSGSTGLTSATGTVKILNPAYQVSMNAVIASTTAGSNVVVIQDGIASQPAVTSIYISNPIAIGGLVLQGQYAVVPGSYVAGAELQIYATDVIGNPALAAYSTFTAGGTVTAVTFAAGTPNTLTIATMTTTWPPGDAINVIVADGSITGTYKILSSSATTVTVATSLSSYTFSTTGSWNVNGTTPQFYTTSGSTAVSYFLPRHGLSVGDTLNVLNPTLVGGVIIQGQYTVVSVPDTSDLTFNIPVAATATSQQYQGAIPITSGSLAGTVEILNYSAVYSSFNPVGSGELYIQGINPANWNGNLTLLLHPSSTQVEVRNTSATGSYVSGGSLSNIGGNYANLMLSTYPLGSLGNSISAGFWTLDSWGNDLIAVSGNTVAINYPTMPMDYQPIFFWDATGGVTAQPIFTGPQANNGAFVAMPQRQIVAWGSTFSGIIDPLLIRWCDINNFNTWVAQVINQAGSFRLPSGARIVGARQVFQQGLIWTDIELWSMTYINQPYVYAFNKIGQGCGLIGKYAHGVLGGIVYWMGKSQFFMTSGEGVQPIPCPIWDVAFQDLDLVNVSQDHLRYQCDVQ